MDVISHLAEGMDAVLIPFNTLLQQECKTTTIMIREKYILPTITTKHDMIKSAGIMNTRFAGHKSTIKKQYQIVKPDPVICQSNSPHFLIALFLLLIHL